jgi:hypothetical protein
MKFFKRLFCKHIWSFIGRTSVMIDLGMGKIFYDEYVCTKCNKGKIKSTLV